VIADTLGGSLDVWSERGLQSDTLVGEEAVARLDLLPGLEAASQSLAALPGEVNQNGAKSPVEARAERNISELVLDPLLNARYMLDYPKKPATYADHAGTASRCGSSQGPTLPADLVAPDATLVAGATYRQM